MSDDGDDVRASVRPAIVCTLFMPRHAGTVVTSFIRYHLHIGFDHIFLFFDGKKDSTIRDARAFSEDAVTVIERTEDLRDRLQKSCARTWKRIGKYYDEEVQARQTLNAELALQLAKERHVDWLLHIDSDELFYTKEASVKSHFEALNRKGIYQLTYTNHEGVPERCDVGDYYKEVTLFRRHYFSLNMSEDVRECMKWWERRTAHGQYFLAYDNGKSATRVVDGVAPKSVHSWELPPKFRERSFTTLVDPRSLDLKRIYRCEDPCILHYVVCGLDWFWSKYKILGAFPSSWFGGSMPIAPCFHTDSRDVFAEGSRETAEAFFRKQVLIDPSSHGELVRRNMRNDVLFRCCRVRDILVGGEKESVALSTKLKEAGSADEDKRKPSAKAPRSVHTYDKAWMISNITKRFLLERGGDSA